MRPIDEKIKMPKVKIIEVKHEPCKKEEANIFILGKPFKTIYMLDEETKKELKEKAKKDKKINLILSKSK